MKLNSNKGFSLVELMVVVAIIGILASIAIPSVNKYMAKARQTEAKTNLSSLYTAEKAFAAEYNTYTADFAPLGLQPEGRMRYNFGFESDGTPALTDLGDFGYSGTTTSAGVDADGYCGINTTRCTVLVDANVAGFGTPASPPGALTTFTTSNVNFVATAQGKISTSFSVYDQWDIDDTKNITNPCDGTTGSGTCVSSVAATP